MKKIFQLTALLMLSLLGACSEDAMDDMSGKYDMERGVYTRVSEQTTDKVGKGIKRLNIKFGNDAGNQWSLSVYSKEWVLQGGIYQVAADPNTITAGTCISTVGGADMAQGNIEVTLYGDTYYIDGLFSASDGRRYSCDYKGSINFEIGEDDPEATGYTIAITEGAVTDADGNVYSDLTKYAIVVSDPVGAAVMELDAVNRAGAKMDDLVGTYTIQGYPTEAGLADNGWVVYYPEWGVEMAGGSYYTDAEGVKRYVTGGQVTITRAEDSEGTPLYSFSGSNLPSLTAQNVPAEGGAFSLLFATYVEVAAKGTVIRDMTLHSEVLDKDMLYSIYLPPSWDGEKTFPVLYLLHGANSAPYYGDGSPGNNGWIDGGGIDTQVDMAIASGTAPEMIVVMPNCTVDGQDLFYVDGYQGTAQYATYFFTEFLPAVEFMFKAQSDREHRAIGGLSMGGYGSLYYGGLHPEMFSYVYACSPVSYVDGAPNLYDLYGTIAFSDVALPGITIEIGTSDFLFESTGYFEQFLAGMGIQHDYITRDGAHDWAFWSACTPKIVKKLGEVFPAE